MGDRQKAHINVNQDSGIIFCCAVHGFLGVISLGLFLYLS